MLNARGLSAPYVLDRTRAQLTPYTNDEWWRHPSGVWVPVLSGGVGVIGRYQVPRFVLGFVTQIAPVGTTHALDSAYVAGTGGDAVASKVFMMETLTLTNIYFNIVSPYTGIAANVTNIDWEIRTGTVSAPTTTGGGLVATGTIDPASAVGWINISGLSQSLTAGTIYFIIIGDANGNGTDYATALRYFTYGGIDGTLQYALAMTVHTANGFITTTPIARGGPIVLVFSDGTVSGIPFATAVLPTSGTNRKGLRLDGLTEQLKVFGWVSEEAGGISGIELIAGDTVPGGSTIASSTWTITNSTNVKAGAVFATPQTLAKATPYRCVMTFGSAGNMPRKVQIGTGVDANLRAAMLGGGSWYYAEANGTTDWANDDVNAWPNMGVWIEDQVEIVSDLGMMASRQIIMGP